MNITQMERTMQDRLPAYAWPGGYTIIYLTRGGDILCADCATTDLDALCDGDLQSGMRGYYHPDDVHYAELYDEGPPEACVECNVLLLASYGDPDADPEPGYDD